jgi:hypothetical protein
MKAPISGHADFQISKAVRCFWRTWSARSPHLAVSDYVLWGYVKSKVYAKRPVSINDSKQRI